MGRVKIQWASDLEEPSGGCLPEKINSAFSRKIYCPSYHIIHKYVALDQYAEQQV